ncbi:MAG: cytochrome C oxidase subunit IV family protein [Candidatus Eisenbacteria bacterium]|uniref:Cytochrome C oxidase subunit IV family protein n=1 Tax=Eiseniibacteriota bacterium TaxID=2212470 RepID=A0A9D6LAY7_UNCEI|nr:cytochrome C oxidase subunit IV family protein [Candidatus Eisenbacteria bacterium]MBI3540107.1 cytochrome C oxidase subunit IV family protein [Candidatus Eisenbacteria bacterium]
MTDHEHGEHATSEHAHPGAKAYVGIAVILTVITAFEVAIFYIPQMHPVLVPSLLTLSALKFTLVVMFYMHLKFDHRLFSWLFVMPMILAAAVILALMKLFGVF